jgi:hypothetical protein
MVQLWSRAEGRVWILISLFREFTTYRTSVPERPSPRAVCCRHWETQSHGPFRGDFRNKTDLTMRQHWTSESFVLMDFISLFLTAFILSFSSTVDSDAFEPCQHACNGPRYQKY